MVEITLDDCGFAVLRRLYIEHNKPIPEYLSACNGPSNGPGHYCITLDELIRRHEHYKNELDLGSLY
jgi:hypothetical protein